MRSYGRWGVVMLALGGLLVMSATVMAGPTTPDPAKIVQVAITKITNLTGARVQVNQNAAAATVAKVKQLLAAGKKAQAAKVASDAIKAIQDGSVETVKHIHSLAKAAAKAVVAAGGTADQVKQIQTAAEAGAKTVQDSAKAAVTQIRDALAGK